MNRQWVLPGVVLGAVLFGLAAFGQVKTFLLFERNVAPSGARVRFESDGGCMFSADGVASYDWGLELSLGSDEFAFNGARCGVLRGAAKAALNHAAQVSDGGVP
jgi:hypothetical protein